MMKNEKKYLLKEILICYTLFGFPLFSLQGIFALLEITPASLNGVNYTGIKGFFIPFIYLLFFGIGLGFFNFIVLKIGNYFKEKLKL
jgi:hypothetical protein